MATRLEQFECARCDTFVGVGSEGTLIGGYRATLCSKCKNIWHVYIVTHPSWDELHRNNVQQSVTLAMCADGKDRSSALLDLSREDDLIRQKLFDVAKEWVNTREEA